jgi:periplasmic mercuric ion binding protein
MKFALFAAGLGLAAAVWTSGAVAAERTVTLAVENMTCASCPPIVRKSLERVAGVSRADVSLEKKTAVVAFDDAKADPPALIAATASAGFPSRVMQ